MPYKRYEDVSRMFKYKKKKRKSRAMEIDEDYRRHRRILGIELNSPSIE